MRRSRGRTLTTHAESLPRSSFNFDIAGAAYGLLALGGKAMGTRRTQ